MSIKKIAKEQPETFEFFEENKLLAKNEIKKYQDENQKLKDIINSIKDLIV